MGGDGRCSCFLELPESCMRGLTSKCCNVTASPYRYQGQSFRLSGSQAAYAATRAHGLVAHA